MHTVIILMIAFLSIAGVIIRPFNVPEAVWAVVGALLLVMLNLVSPAESWEGISKSTDVYLFLAGMMILAETARSEKLFDWLANHATAFAKGSSSKLFLLIYITGAIVTIFLSNDATAVVLTPAVAAAVRAAKVKNAIPYLLICAFIANAASFVLPISNPANLVIYGDQMPALFDWLRQYTLPSLLAIVITFFTLKFTQRKYLKENIETEVTVPPLTNGGRIALWGIVGTAVILLISSGFNISLGLPTAIAGITTSAIVIITAKKNPWPIIKGISWAVLPLVAGLFVIVEALYKTVIINALTNSLQQGISQSVTQTVWASGLLTAFGCNLVNNLPAGLVAGNVVQLAHAPNLVKGAVLIGIDLGPNLSITGSLATILWLVALRREGITVSAWTFLKTGFIVMTTALVFALAALWI